MKTLKVFNTVMEAHMLRSRLESCGITAVVLDEDKPYTGGALLGVRLAVGDGQYEEALALLQEWDAGGESES